MWCRGNRSRLGEVMLEYVADEHRWIDMARLQLKAIAEI